MYDFVNVEKKWQEFWKVNETFKFDDNDLKKKLYCLVMFPYPSGAKLHMGHWWQYSLPDSWVKMKKMQGENVFFPMGFDAFGLPAENYAIKTGIHPQDSTEKNIETMETQFKNIGVGYDWDYELITCNPDYYKWTQWMFLKLYEHGLAYKKEAPVNWCPSCNTVLANEQVINGECERCESTVIRKKMNQWFFKITDYAEELLNDLDKLNWPEKTKILQTNWIGKSKGAFVDFKVSCTEESFRVFTTRADTLFGATYCVLSPEHPLVNKITTNKQMNQVEKYIEETIKQSEIDRTSTVKEKTGVFTGAYAINPVNGKEIPIWIADYVLLTYGTGAIMAVPAHDERDYEFAKKFGLEIIPVLEGGDTSKEAYIGDGLHINSQFLDNLNKEESIKLMIKWLTDNNYGEETTNYKLRDWLVSRQRYWGSPIPMIYCDNCGIVPVPEQDLPVELPYNVAFTPDGSSPLAKCEEFVNCNCPKCGNNAKREVDTLDTFVCSSWYYLRFPDNNNIKEPFNKDIINKILPIDRYIGGIEHACMHLLYARFFTKALRDMGYLDFDEPFKELIHQGIVLGPDGEKMSKSKGNTIAPEEYVEKYGSDALRMYLMFGFNYLEGGPWNDDGALAIDRFLKRVIRLFEDNKDRKGKKISEVDKVLHNTIKKVTNDVDKFSFNTAVARIMEYVNILYKYQDTIDKYYIKQLILILAPFVPHMAEELWQQLGNKKSIFLENYPIYNESKIIEDTVTIAISVNGKLRATVDVPLNMNKEALIDLAKQHDNVSKYILNKEIVKEIVVPNKIINIVVK